MKYPGLLIRQDVAFVLGVVMYAAAEKDPFSDLYQDSNFWPNISISILTVFIVLHVNHHTVLWVDHLLSFHRRSHNYYSLRYLAQFVLSFVPTLLAALSLAYFTVEIIHGQDIWKTSYFQFDIYLVVFLLIAWQINYAVIYWSHTHKLQSLLEEDRDYTLLLSLVEKERKLSLKKDAEGLVNPQKILTLEDTVDSIPLSDIAYFYTKKGNYFIRTFDGSQYGLTLTITQLLIILPEEHFIYVRPSLIVSVKTIKKVIQLPNSIYELSADPEYVVNSKMSRKATRDFKDWEEEHPDSITW